MRPRRFMLRLVVPRTLADDDEALQAFGSMYWREMLERAGGIPAENTMLRVIRAEDLPDNSATGIEESSMVPIHVIGYATPRIEEPSIDMRLGIDLSAFTTSIDELIQGLVGAEMTVQIPITNDFEGGLSGSLFPLGGRHGIVQHQEEQDEFYYRGYSEEDFDAPLQEEGWGDAMRWTPGDGKGEL